MQYDSFHKPLQNSNEQMFRIYYIAYRTFILSVNHGKLLWLQTMRLLLLIDDSFQLAVDSARFVFSLILQAILYRTADLTKQA